MTAASLAPAFAGIIKSRYSVRAFRPERVPQALMDQVFTLAAQGDSACDDAW